MAENQRRIKKGIALNHQAPSGANFFAAYFHTHTAALSRLWKTPRK